MYRSMCVLAMLLALLPLSASAEWLEFGAGCPEGSEPRVFHDITLDDRICFDVELQGLLADTVVHDSIPYLRFHESPGTTPLDSTGFPELPVVVCFVAVPDDADLDISYTANCVETLALSLPIYPAPLDSLVTDSTSTPYVGEFFTRDSTAYASEEWYPEELAEIVGEFHLRDQRVAIVAVHPVQYLASEDSLRVWGDLEMSVLPDGEEMDWNQDGLGYYDLLVGDVLLGYHPDYTPIENASPDVERHEDPGEPPDMDPDYVILVADGLDGEWIDDFAEYRADLNGFDVLIANTEDIRESYDANSTWITAGAIRDYLEALWDWTTPATRPTYLLLIGDHETSTHPGWLLPTYEDEALDDMGNDEWFVYFGEPRSVSSAIPDMIAGRLPTRDTDELEDMLALIEDYEAPVQTPGPSVRRHIVRLAGTDEDGFYQEDLWQPSIAWTETLKDWLGYSWETHYCGDGDPSTSSDGSTMSSRQWTEACIDGFENGAQVAFYSDHGDYHLFSAGLDWGIPGLGAKDSTFDNLDVLDLTPSGQGYCHPFILMLCCSAGTFNHDGSDHPQEYPGYESLCLGIDGNGHPYDFGTDCLAEAFMRNTEGGAIGVFAGSNSSCTDMYEPLGTAILEALYLRGITRTGDAILAGRLDPRALMYFYCESDPTGWQQLSDLGRFNLMGDPVVDIGDRVKFPSCCDLIISPEDLVMARYPSGPDAHGSVILGVTVRNAGGAASGAFDVDLTIEDAGHHDVVTVRCPGLEVGEERTLEFAWAHNGWFTPPGDLFLTAVADFDEECSDSWRGNNDASTTIEVVDFYPNDTGWPVRTDASIKVPPVLCDLDGVPGRDLEILLAQSHYLRVYRCDDPEPIWTSDVHDLCQGDRRTVIPGPPPDTILVIGCPSIPSVGNVLGDGGIEIIIDGVDELLVFDLSTSEPLCAFEHGDDWAWNMPHTVALGDFVEEADHAERDEIVVSRGPKLMVFDIDDGELRKVIDENLIPPPIVPQGSSLSTWPLVEDINGTGHPEILVQVCWKPGGGTYRTEMHVYDVDAEDFIGYRQWSGCAWRTVPCIGALPTQGLSVVISSGVANSSTDPALILDATDDELGTMATCEWLLAPSSYQVPCCLMADWSSTERGADRVLANAENRCFAWDEDGYTVTPYPIGYSGLAGSERPPFPALGNLDDYQYADYLVATREGSIMAYDDGGDPLDDLGFPYFLPSYIYGGFAVADIDNDGYVEVVFGTMDNYLHVWELGECNEGYAPWPQCQHDAARTGLLLEE